MTHDEFRVVWVRLLSKLTAEEQQLLDDVVSGAQVNHTLLYMVVALVIGLIGGWSLAHL